LPHYHATTAHPIKSCNILAVWDTFYKVNCTYPDGIADTSFIPANVEWRDIIVESPGSVVPFGTGTIHILIIPTIANLLLRTKSFTSRRHTLT